MHVFAGQTTEQYAATLAAARIRGARNPKVDSATCDLIQHVADAGEACGAAPADICAEIRKVLHAAYTYHYPMAGGYEPL